MTGIQPPPGTSLPVPEGALTIGPPPVDEGATIRLSVVVPTFNEAPNIREVVSRLALLLDGAFGTHYEIIVVDDNSPDRTWELAQGLASEFPSLRVMRREREHGLSTAVTENTTYGYGIEIPYFWAIAPDYDATFNPRFTTQQGVLMQAEFRQRLVNGSYQVRAYGIDQQDPAAFAGQPGDRQFRGGIETKGEFALNDKWVWGWDGVAVTDYMVMSDYRLSVYKDPLRRFWRYRPKPSPRLYLTGVGNRSYFDARAIYYLSLSGNQSQVPVVAPVIDYSNVINHPVLGGEFSYKGNFTSLTRDTAAFDPITAAALANGSCLPTSADPARNITPANCLLRGMPGTYTRATGEVDWRTSFTDSIGEIWTPFASVRADAINSSVANQPGVSNFLATGESQARAGDAHDRPRIPLPLHQRPAVGHHHDRTDRAGHRPPQRT